MNGGDDQQIDQMLTAHLRDRLEPQLGRAAAAFEAAEPAATPRASAFGRRLVLGLAVAGGSIAAVIAMALAHVSSPEPSQPPSRVHPLVAKPPPPPPPPRVADSEPNFERLVLWRAVDEGAEVVGDNLPVRRVRYEALEQIEWVDPAQDATIQLSRPVDELVLVQQRTF